METTEGAAYRAALMELSNLPRAPRRHVKVARKMLAKAARLERDQAFREALLELFKRYPISELMHEMHHAVRGSALRKAGNGGYCDYAPGGMVRWRNFLADVAGDWNVPADELLAIHLLIYQEG